jgi:hypothetical protein
MEHTFFIYYKRKVHELEPLIKLLNGIKIPMNRTGISVGPKNEISSININPFNPEFYGLQISFQFTNYDRRWNKLQKENVVNLESEFEFEQRCFLSYHNLDESVISVQQLNLVELIYNTIASNSEILVYSNGHFYFKLDLENVYSNKKALVKQIEEWNS